MTNAPASDKRLPFTLQSVRTLRPRIPFAPDFKAFANAGKKLADLHLNYEQAKEWPLKFIEAEGVPLSYRVEDKMRFCRVGGGFAQPTGSKKGVAKNEVGSAKPPPTLQDKTSLRVNESLTLAGIPPEVFNHRLGNRSALEWVIDQYRVTEDERSGIRSDPNREDDPEYIVRLVGQVVRVSVETVKIVAGLPEEYC